jgi:protein SCO1/2
VNTRPLLVLAAFLALAGCTPSSGAESRPATTAVRVSPAVAKPDVVLEDQAGEPWSLRAETRGKVTLLFFGYTNCPDVCPVHMANLAAVLRRLPIEVTRQIQTVFVTTDPDRDTPERLKEWLGALHPSFVGLRGTPAEVQALEEAVGVPVSVVDTATATADGGYFVGHAAQLLAFGKDDTARVAYPWGTRQRDWLRDLPLLVRGDDPLMPDQR